MTPLNPTGWSLTFDGETITLSPSIGNWNFKCRSHYIIDRSRIIWAADNPDHDSFPIEEVMLFNEVKKNSPSSVKVHYGDYGSVNPLRSDQKFALGWRPRIDFPTSRNMTFYYREKREGSYEAHYVSVAQNIIKDSNFENLDNSWGVKQIEDAARGNPAGKNPRFWISVRMEIHIRQQLRKRFPGSLN